MNMPKQNKKAKWVADVVFIFEEIERIQKLIAATPPDELRNLSRSDFAGYLPHPSGRGSFLCGAQAARRIAQLADKAFSPPVTLWL
jgi:hypothetical protein